MKAKAPDSINELKPRFALEVAVVGNRRFAVRPDGEEEPGASARMKGQVAEALDVVWSEIAMGMKAVRAMALPPVNEAHGHHETDLKLKVGDFFAEGHARLGILTGMAAGVDQMAAERALAAKVDGVDFEVEALMPFPEADYPGLPGAERREFTIDEAQKLRDLCAQCVQTVRLDGVYAAGQGDGSEPGRVRAYRQVRDMLLQNADLLVSVFDPTKAGKAGGTVEAMRVALRSNLPVLAVMVHPEKGVRLNLCRKEEEVGDALFENATPLDGEKRAGQGWRTDLQRLLAYLLAVPHMQAAPEEGDVERMQREKAYAAGVSRLREFLGMTKPHSWCRCLVRANCLPKVWNGLVWIARLVAKPHGFTRFGEKVCKVNEEILVEPYRRAAMRAGELSGLYMGVYRGAFVLAFLLAGLATSAAVTMLVLTLVTHHHVPVWCYWVLGFGKVGMIGALIWMERAAHREKWQEHASDHRYMAELLRPMQWLAPLGAAVPVVELPIQYAPLDPRQGWMHWMFRAIARSVPSVCTESDESGKVEFRREVQMTPETAKEAVRSAAEQWVEGQRCYHHGAARKMHWIENGLERLAKTLLWIVLVSAVLAFGLEMCLAKAWPFGWCPSCWGEHWKDVLNMVAAILTGIAAALPAFIAALGGIMFQSEAKRLELRSEAMYHGLKKQKEDLQNMIKAIDADDTAREGASQKAATRLRSLAELMISETGDWKALYQVQEVKAG